MTSTRSDLYGILDDSSFPELAPAEHRAVRERANRRAPKQTTSPSTAGGMALVAAYLVAWLTEKLLGISTDEGGIPSDRHAYTALIVVSVLGFLAGYLPSKAKEKAHYLALKDEFEAALRIKQTAMEPVSPSSTSVPRNPSEPPL